MSVISKVGLGWPVGERDFDLLDDFLSAINRNTHNTALCSGLIVTSNTTISGEFPGGLLVTGHVPFDGSNLHELPLADNCLSIGSANVIVRWVKIDGPDGFLQSARLLNNGTSDSFFEECYISAKATNTTGVIASNNSGSNRGFRRCYIDFSGRVTGYATGWGTSCTFDGCLFYGYTNTAVRSTTGGSTADRHFRNNIAVEGTGSDFDITQFATYDNNATADSTGQFTGYGKAEFVDFDGGDLRIKATSDLVALGIGAFFQTGDSPGEPLPDIRLVTFYIQATTGCVVATEALKLVPVTTVAQSGQQSTSQKVSNVQLTTQAESGQQLTAQKKTNTQSNVQTVALTDSLTQKVISDVRLHVLGQATTSVVAVKSSEHETHYWAVAPFYVDAYKQTEAPVHVSTIVDIRGAGSFTLTVQKLNVVDVLVGCIGTSTTQVEKYSRTSAEIEALSTSTGSTHKLTSVEVDTHGQAEVTQHVLKQAQGQVVVQALSRTELKALKQKVVSLAIKASGYFDTKTWNSEVQLVHVRFHIERQLTAQRIRTTTKSGRWLLNTQSILRHPMATSTTRFRFNTHSKTNSRKVTGINS